MIVIGGGPAGYAAALTAAKKGRQTVLVEQAELGGTCLNRGCIPTKALAKSAGVYSLVKGAKGFGILSSDAGVDWASVMGRKRAIVDGLRRGLQSLIKGAGISLVSGRATLQGGRKVEVVEASGKVTLLEGDAVIVASGSTVKNPFPCTIDEKDILSSTGILELSELPESLIIVGGGVIGLEFANIFNAFGVKVTVIEALPRLLYGIDEEAATLLMRIFKRRGVEFRLSAKVSSIEKVRGKVRVALEAGNGSVEEVVADKVLLAVGRAPNVDGLGLERAGVELENGQIKVDNQMRTTSEGIYAAGDVVGNPMLAHAGFMEGEVAARVACGEEVSVDWRAIPSCVYTSPEVAQVGLSEEEARKHSDKVIVGKYPLRGNGRVLIEDESGEDGFIKVVADRVYGEVLGVTMVGPFATELIGLGVLAINNELTVEQMAETVQGHPTVCEAIREAALIAVGRPLHFAR
ncbi:MAG: dihydrolipoyl dehydrogenase [Thermoanaerobacteraceae bacterium]|nr:dihydrolipoyl dehydrogenase [Thermoanaerobacteraceae bacterium]